MLVYTSRVGQSYSCLVDEDDDEDASLEEKEEEEEERKEMSERGAVEEEDDWEAEIDAICRGARKPPHYDSDDVLSPELQLAGTSQVPPLRPDLLCYIPSMQHSLPILWSAPRAPRPLPTPEQFEDAEQEE